MKNGVIGICVRKREMRVIIPVLLGILFGLGDEVSNQEGTLDPLRISLYVKILLFAMLFIIVFRWLSGVLEASGRAAVVDDHRMPASHPVLDRLFRYDWSIRSVARYAMVIFACWLPYVVLLFPGVYWSDTSKQLLMHYGVEPLTDHHPFLLTYVFGWFADFGQWVFHNPIYGLYLLILVQVIVFPVLFSMIVTYSRYVGASRVVCHAELAFFALFPVFPVMFSSLSKDSITLMFFLPFCLLFAQIVGGESARGRWVFLALFLCGMATCMTKKAGLYYVLPSLLFVCFIKLSRRAKITMIACGALIAMMMMVVIPHVLMPSWGVVPGGKQEGIAFAIQQVAHDVTYDADAMTAQEKKLVSSFLSVEYHTIPSRYNPQIADPVKGTSLRDPSLMGDFMGLWMRKTLEHPLGHLEAGLGLIKGWFSFRNNDGSPNYMIVCTESAWYYDPILEYVPQWPIRAIRSGVARAVYDTEQSIPGVNIFFSRAVWASVVPFFLLYLALRPEKGKWRRLIGMMPLNMSFAYLLFVPVSGMGGEPTRYVLQLICMAPLFLCATCLPGTHLRSRADLRTGRAKIDG